MEVLSYLALAQTWNLLAGYTGLISVGQQAYVGLGGYLFFALAMFTGVPVLAALPIAGLMVGLLYPDGVGRFPAQGRLFRGWHLGHRGGLPAFGRSGHLAWRRLRYFPASQDCRINRRQP